jgi:mRNA interferase MazF
MPSSRPSKEIPRNRGEIWIATLGKRYGTEPGKTRSVLIVQDQALLGAGHPSTLIVPLTTNLVADAEPLRLRIPARGRLRQDSDLLVDQLRAIDNNRLLEGPLVELDRDLMRSVDDCLRQVLGIFN